MKQKHRFQNQAQFSIIKKAVKISSLIDSFARDKNIYAQGKSILEMLKKSLVHYLPIFSLSFDICDIHHIKCWRKFVHEFYQVCVIVDITCNVFLCLALIYIIEELKNPLKNMRDWSSKCYFRCSDATCMVINWCST